MSTRGVIQVTIAAIAGISVVAWLHISVFDKPLDKGEDMMDTPIEKAANVPISGEVIKNAIQMINDGLPKQINEVTRFDKVAYLPGNIYAQYFTLTSSDRAPYNDTASLKPRITQSILNNIKTNQGFAAFKSYNVTFEYVYRDKKEQPLFTITITPEQYNN